MYLRVFWSLKPGLRASQVDALNTKAHNQMLKERLETLSADLTDREKLIDQSASAARGREAQMT